MEIKLNRYYNIDNMEYMKDLPDKFFDLAIVDPPYGIGFDKEKIGMSDGIRKDGSIRYDKSWPTRKAKKYKPKEWDDKPPEKEYFDELRRVSKKQIIWGGNYFTDKIPTSGGWVVWEKGVPDGMSLSQAELAWTNVYNSIRIKKILWAGYKKHDSKEIRIHSTQKPVALYRWLLQNYAKPGDSIFDSHVGSGSSIIACIEEGHDYVGCELDKDYFETSTNRIEEFKKQGRLFD